MCVQNLRVSIHRKRANNILINQYSFIVNKYPHQIRRHHRLASGAGADRISQGMRLAFGHPLIRASQNKQFDKIIQIRISHSIQRGQVQKYIFASAKTISIKTKIHEPIQIH